MIVLPSYIGIIINHYKDPYESTSIMESEMVFFVAHLWIVIQPIFNLESLKILGEWNGNPGSPADHSNNSLLELLILNPYQNHGLFGKNQTINRQNRLPGEIERRFATENIETATSKFLKYWSHLLGFHIGTRSDNFNPYGWPSKNRGFLPPKSSHFSRVFHEINHPFCG